ncbi:MAG: DUF373 family protein [Candidatus Micrarchaeota archaeon]|nr:DUF373 family protein [Candidatus Micrarchaeota archaeon]
MPKAKFNLKNKEEKLLILSVDVDNDLYRKTKISGPLLGRVQNLNGATQLALADPEDSDANGMFYAVKLYDKMKEEGYLVNIATITGSEAEGYHAGNEVARQLDLVLRANNADACILVTDGASDKQVIPIIESRIRINGVQVVTIKQAEKLENTYFAIIEKLKEPHYSRIVFGLPALVILLFTISYIIGAGWFLPAVLIGIYLMVKGFGLEEVFISSFQKFGFSIDRMSFVFYLSAMLFVIAGGFLAAYDYYSNLSVTNNVLVSTAYLIEGFLLMLPIALVLYLIGRMIDVRNGRYMFRGFKYGMYMTSSIILWILLYSFTEWLVGQIYFSQLINYTIAAIAIGIVVSITTNQLRKHVLKDQKLKDKMVVNELGAMIGKIGGIDINHGKIVINTSFGNPITYSVDRIVDVQEKVVIK